MKAYKPLMDESLDPEEVKIIRETIERYCKENIKYHDLRTRKAGNYNYVDFHLNLDENLTVKEAHDLCDLIEKEIKLRLVNSEITIHVENF
jgi:divalent metal cation (Fe/Co/Zn/Cd) transporter